MIFTVTCNPALDYTLTMPTMRPGVLNRTQTAVLTYGGKGINVSRMLTALGAENTAIVLVAGETGAMLERGLENEGIRTECIRLAAGSTRINVKIRAGEETELNADGPAVDAAAWETLCRRVGTLNEEDVLCLCGSVPSSLGAGAYAELMTHTKARVAVDASGDLLRQALAQHPWLIKPNRPEMEGLFRQHMTNESTQVDMARRVQEMGAQNVLLSLGASGAMLYTADGNAWRCAAPRGETHGTVGAGDCALAGYLSAVGRGEKEALRTAVAAGSAAAFSDGCAPGAAAVEALLRQMPAL